MRILHIETGRHLYGGALQVYYLIKGLRSFGCQSVLVCPSHSQIADAVRPVADIYSIPIAGDLDFGFIFRLIKIIRREKPDLVHAHSRRGADIWGGVGAYLTSRPAVVTRRVDNPEIPQLAKIKYKLYKRVITISNGIKNVLLEGGLSAKKIVCVHSAVDTELYSKACHRDWFLREFGLSPRNIIIGMVAQFIERKGHRYLFEAMPRIIKRFPETVFLLFGKGPLQNTFKKRIAEQGDSDIIRFAGFRDDLDRILSCLDLLVHPALMEGLGVSLIQAAACGVPIVASKVGGIPEIVHNGENGYLIEPASSDELAQKIVELLQNRSRLKQFAAQGPKIVEKYFSIDSMVKGNFEVYKKVLGR